VETVRQVVEGVVRARNMRRPGFVALAVLWLGPLSAIAADKPRLVVLTDIGEDPDDQQSLTRLLVHANEFDIEGLIATASGTPGKKEPEVVRPHLIRQIVEAYGKVQPNLRKHHPDFPEAKVLLDRVQAGSPKRGMESVGAGKDTDGSHWIISVVDRADDRPVNVTVWGGPTELAQALWRVRNDRTPDQLKAFVRKLRVYSIGHQDDTGPWIIKEFPDLFYVLSKAPEGRDKREGGYRGMYLGGDESLTSREWVDRHVRKDHGPLGALYPVTGMWTAPNPHATLKEGDTPSWFYFLPVGLGDPAQPTWGGWGGRFKHVVGGRFEDSRDTVNGITDARATVWRWRPAYQNEFAARMDWCVKAPKDSNHPPVPAIEGFPADVSGRSVALFPRAGERFDLSATGSTDPDANKLSYRWFVYREAGTYDGNVKLDGTDKKDATVNVPANAKEKTIHVVLEVTDDGSPALTRYRRAILKVR
jgi:Cellulose-binding Sde182, nucleoside hydrolase-like domain/Cellulose-binding protein Sde0182, C-terminal domain